MQALDQPEVVSLSSRQTSWEVDEPDPRHFREAALAASFRT